ncbi:MAG TPA: glycosyltransferase family 2 protein [Caldilineae bacterium]|nr:glycosyltransferase family 2 protein [Caldilineae bacterium]
MPDHPTDRSNDQATARLTCAILAKNVADHIGDCVRSCSFADDVVVFDTASADNTVQIATAAGARVINTPFVNFSQARNVALRALDSEWVLFVDADERVTPELAQEVGEAIQRPDVDGWWVPRYNHIVGHVMRGGGWYPDHQLRLLRRAKAYYDEAREVHEIAIIDGPEGHLSEHLIHYNYDDWGQFHAKQRRYTAYEAQTLLGEGVRAHPRHLLTRPLQAFWRRFVTWKGYRDGLHGLRLCAIMAKYEFLKYWWMLRDRRDPS